MEGIPAISPLLPMFISQLLLGTVYAIYIHEIAVHKWLEGNTALWVVIGVSLTLGIQFAFIQKDWQPWTVFGSFACSGLPMVVSYWYRHQAGVEKMKQQSHKRRPWPTAAAQVRDLAIMDLSKIIVDIEEKANKNEVTAGFLLGVSNTLHGIIKVLKSV